MRIRGEVVKIRLKKPECKQRTVDGFLAQIYDEVFQCHGLVVQANDEMA